MNYLNQFMYVHFKNSYFILLINYSCVCFVQVSSDHLAGSNSGSPGSDSLDAELFFDLEDGGTTCNQTEEQLNQVNGGIGGNSPADSEDDEDKVINRYGHLNTIFSRWIFELY